MKYETLSEIFSSMDETRARLFERVASLSPAQKSARLNAEGWTVAEIIEHLSIVEKQIVRLATLMLTKAEAAGAMASSDGRIGPVSLDGIAERSAREKYQAPETSLPVGLAVDDSLDVMRASREALHRLRPRFEVSNLSSVNYPHPVFGPLNLYEWLVLIGLHEDRHMRQIDVVLSSSNKE
jgi:hypothetical protein